MTIQYFPFVPEYLSWEEWNGNLIMYFGEDPIPYMNEANWKTVAANVTQLPDFEVFPIPSPDTYSDWRDWAKEFALIINGPQQ